MCEMAKIFIFSSLQKFQSNKSRQGTQELKMKRGGEKTSKKLISCSSMSQCFQNQALKPLYILSLRLLLFSVRIAQSSYSYPRATHACALLEQTDLSRRFHEIP